MSTAGSRMFPWISPAQWRTRRPAFICKACVQRIRQFQRPFSFTRRASLEQLPLDLTRPPQSRKRPSHLEQLPISSYWDTTPPSPRDLRAADLFFQRSPPSLLWCSSTFRQVPVSPTHAPEVAFLGRSNVGKSSLLNALLNRANNKIAHVSKRPGRTRTMNAFSVNGGKLVVVDMPGYGHGSQEQWGTEIMKYLSRRKEMRRAFLLVDSTHGLKDSDMDVLLLLRQHAIPHQVILSKADRILFPSGTSANPSEETLTRRMAELQRQMATVKELIQPHDGTGPPALGELIACSAEKTIEKGKKLGVSAVRWAALSAAGLEGRKDKVQPAYADYVRDIEANENP